MKKLIKTALIILVLVLSCRKIDDQSYTVKFYGDSYEDIGYSVSIASDGYVIAGQLTDVSRTGNFITGTNKNMGIIKTGWDGNVVWKLSAGGVRSDWGSKLFKNDDGSYICVGTYTDSTNVVQTDVFVVKVSAEGSVVWQKNYSRPGNQTGVDLVKTGEGYLVLCTTDRANLNGNIEGNTDIQFMRITANGDTIGSSPQFGFSGNDIGVAIKQALDGNYIVFGTTDRSQEQNQDKNNLLLLLINSSGTVLQSEILGTSADEYAADFEVVRDGYLLTYTIGQDGDAQEIWVKKMQADLFAAPVFTSKVSVTTPGATDNSNKVYAITRRISGYYLLSGIYGKTTAAKMMVCEIDSTGTLVAGHQIIKGSTGVQYAYDVTAGEDGFIIAVGKNSYDVNSMITFLKFKF